ncbi:MAG: bile acid:sodium symporter [Deltaproteobacteria bacterium]|nr:bile acid:sodium symporter [Deltaproteobacteria bacterium]
MDAFLRKNWFFLGIFIVILSAFGLPGLGRWAREYDILNVVIFVAFFITGLTLDTSSIRAQLRGFKAPATAMISSLLVIPLLAWIMARLLLSPELLIGVCIIATAPVTVAAGTVMTDLGRGNVPLSLFICVLGNFLAIFTIPVSLNLLLRFGGDIDLPVLKMLAVLALTVLAPTLLGQIVRSLLKERLSPYRKIFSAFQQCTILMIIFNAMASSAGRILQAGLSVILVLAFMVFLHSLILAMNYGLSRVLALDRPSTTAFTIHTSQKTLTVSYVVWAGYFAAQYPMALIPAIGYHLTQTIMDSILAERFRRAAERATRLPWQGFP